MSLHWHAFTYTGARYPDDADAKNVNVAVRPLTLNHWFRKPGQMHQGAYSDVAGAYSWLESELRRIYVHQERLADVLSYHHVHLDLGQDAFSAGYTKDRAGVYVRCLLTCPRTGADSEPRAVPWRSVMRPQPSRSVPPLSLCTASAGRLSGSVPAMSRSPRAPIAGTNYTCC